MTPTKPEDALVERLREAEALWDAFVRARQQMNDARPELEATPAERALYDERYKADHEAERLAWAAAIGLLRDGISKTSADAITTLLERERRKDEALGRIASNGFGHPIRNIDPKRDKEMLAMMDYARAALTGEGESTAP